MQDYGAMIRSTFELGSVRDAELLFETIVKNAFPTFTFRRLELIRVQQDTPYLEGRSWNHVLRSGRVSWIASPSGKSTATASPWARPRTSKCIWII